MYLLLMLLAAGDHLPLRASDAANEKDRCYRTVADGWRRTNQGWENATLWAPDADANSIERGDRAKPTERTLSYVNFIGRLHPAVVAGVQLFSAAYLMHVANSQQHRRGSPRQAARKN